MHSLPILFEHINCSTVTWFPLCPINNSPFIHCIPPSPTGIAHKFNRVFYFGNAFDYLCVVIVCTEHIYQQCRWGRDCVCVRFRINLFMTHTPTPTNGNAPESWNLGRCGWGNHFGCHTHNDDIQVCTASTKTNMKQYEYFSEAISMDKVASSALMDIFTCNRLGRLRVQRLRVLFVCVFSSAYEKGLTMTTELSHKTRWFVAIGQSRSLCNKTNNRNNRDVCMSGNLSEIC